MPSLRYCALALLLALASAQTPPSFNQVPDQNVNQNDPRQSVAISGITQGNADASSLEFFATSDNKALIPDSHISVSYLQGSSASTAVLMYQTATGESGTATITVSIFGQYNGGVLLSVHEFEVAVVKTEVDCQYSDWGAFSTCDRQCGGGRQSRSRSITQQPLGNGARCDPNEQVETRACSQQACQPPTIDRILDQAVMQDSGSYSIDISGVGVGQGESGQVLSIKAESSNHNLVHVSSSDLVYKSPSSMGKLFFTPNPGQSGSANILLTVTDSGTHGSPSSYTTTTSFSIVVTATPVDCLYEWAQWSSCSASCGDGTRTRDSRIIRRASPEGAQCPSPLPSETRSCYAGACPQDCQKKWSEWQTCSVSCGTGVWSRYEVIQAFPENGGRDCGVLEMETAACTQRACAQDCELEWGEWGQCSQSCGQGIYSRTKQVRTPAAAGGRRCESPLPREERPCNLEACPGPNDCSLGMWTEWSICDNTCTRTRNRRVIEPAKSSGSCPPVTQDEACSGEDCPFVGGVSRTSCERQCGTQPLLGGCGCDADCLRYGDCCSDYARYCQGGFNNNNQGGFNNNNQGNFNNQGCQGRCGGQGQGNCWCDPNCERNGDCCSDYRHACTPNGPANFWG